MSPREREAQQAPILPIYAQRQAIEEALRHNQVVIVEGPAGTGKTTQLPRLIQAAGLSKTCIGVTQPRRIAAVSVAWRIAAEEGVELGQQVGYAIRFDDNTSPATRIKIMTDGILLQQVRSDPLLRDYDVIIVDEAHERSLNIDFSLGLLKQILPRRPDLRVVVSSATLHPGHFQRFFAPVLASGADRVPVISIPVRLYPVETSYHPFEAASADDLPQLVASCVLDVHRRGGVGDILAFLPGEGAIKRTEEALRERHRRNDLVILPCFGRLTRQEQERVFDTFAGKRKVVLATNIAETSITIPGVNFCIDTGLAKVPYFDARTCVTTLREEPTSWASAQQRAGRAGRTAPGRVMRLYTEESQAQRRRFLPEEILRVDLSEAVLRLIDLGVRDVEGFPFPTQPPGHKLKAALQTLEALGAIDGTGGLTAVGRRMVPFPLSPHLARMVVEAASRFPQALFDVLVIGAFLSVRSPFLFPAGQEMPARRAHQGLQDAGGDAVTAAKVFHAWRRAGDKQAFCARHFLDTDTLAFVAKAQAQLADIAESLGEAVRDVRARADDLVRCVAAGFADRILLRRGHTYLSTSGVRVALHPSSALYQSRHRTVVAAELMQSGRVYAFNVSPLRPEWVAELNGAAAEAWRLGTNTRRAGRSRGGQRPACDKVWVGDVGLSVVTRGRHPEVRIFADQVATVLAARGQPVQPHEALGWRARVKTRHGSMLRAPLERVLAWLPHVPLPPNGELRRDVPCGALLQLGDHSAGDHGAGDHSAGDHSATGHAQTIGSFLPRLLEVLPGRRRRPGWLVLLSDAAGGYWFEVFTDFAEALRCNLRSLDDLLDAEQAGGDLVEVARGQRQRLAALARACGVPAIS